MGPYEYPENPKTTVWKILQWIQDNPKEVIFSSDIISAFDITNSDAAHRLAKLKSYGILSYANRQVGAKEGYVLSPYGLRFIVQEGAKEDTEDEK